MILNQYDWLNKFYSFYITSVVSVVSRHGLTIEACHINQPNNNSNVALCKPCINFNSHSKQLYINNNNECFSYKGEYGMYIGIHTSRHLNEELAWDTEKWLWVISI